MKFDIVDFVKRTCDYGMSLQLTEGEMPPGRNGPHGHNMTGARTTAHWAILFAFAYEITGDVHYRYCASAAYDALISTKFRPLGGAFWHRKENYRSSYNGLIGQAWTLESLHYGYHALGREDLFNIGKELVMIHPFSEETGLWNEIDLDGCTRGIGMTLNQQIWFAAMASRFLDVKDKKPILFLDSLADRSMFRRSGLFYTAIVGHCRRKHPFVRMRRWLRDGPFVDSRRQIDNGYHLFTMVGLAMLYERFPTHSYFASNEFSRVLAYTFSSDYAEALKQSPFGYQYNVPGFEYPYVYTVFADRVPKVFFNTAVSSTLYQFANHMNPSSQLLNKASVDPATLLARSYEVHRIPPEYWEHI